MIKLQITNKHIYINGINSNTVKLLDIITSYRVSGYMFSPSFKRKRWDGREHLLKFLPGIGYRAPSGLSDDIIKELRKTKDEIQIKYEYEYNGPKIEYQWNKNIALREYQEQAVAAMCSGKRWQRGCGLLKMPIRSGKTKTAAKIIHTLARRALFIVPSQQLMHQSKDSLSESLCMEVGTIGDGTWNIKDVTVATIQSLAKHANATKINGTKKIKLTPDEQYKFLISYFDVIIFDETHHLSADVWHSIVMSFNARYKIGLSATIFLDNEKENERGVIWLKACCGNIRYEVEMDALVKMGFLMKQNIELVNIKEPKGYEKWGWGQELINALIYENAYRNGKIIDKAIEKVEAGLKVLIVSNRLKQIKYLSNLANEKGIKHAVAIGNSTKKSREKRINSFVNGNYNLIIGTIFGEGVDIPEVECVINAEGGSDIKNTIQRMRNMTPSSGKQIAILVDMIDLTNKYFAKHSKSRLDIYRSDSSYQIKSIE